MGVHALALVTGLAFSSVAAALALSKDELKSAREAIAAEFKAARADCQSLSANTKDICMAKAGGREKVAKAELAARDKPSVDASYKLRVARAGSDYLVAKEICDDKAGNAKDVCLKEAKAVDVAAKADAKAKMKTANANNVASEKGADARNEASAARRDAEHAVAREKCDIFAGDAKSSCLIDAKARFGKF